MVPAHRPAGRELAVVLARLGRSLVRRYMRWLILIGAILVCGFLANVLWHQFFLNGA